MKKNDREIRAAFGDYMIGKIGEMEAREKRISFKDGKAIIPTVVAKEIISIVGEENLLRKHGRVVRVVGNLQYPILKNSAEVSSHSEERNSTNTIEVSSLGFDAEILEPIEFDTIATLKQKLFLMSHASLPDLLVQEMAKQYCRKEIDYMFNGTDSKAFNEGSLYNRAKLFVPNETEPSKIIMELKRTPTSRVANKSRWMVNKAALEYVEGLKQTNGEPMLKILDRVESGVSYNLLGFPLDCIDDVKGSDETKAVFYFGDFSSFVIQEASDGLEIKKLDEMFAHVNEMAIKLYNLLDGKLIYSDLEPTVYRLEI